MFFRNPHSFSFEEMEPSVEEKMENKGWLQDHLMKVASFSYSDLQAMKEKGVSCFPPSYNILDFFAKAHHAGLAKLVRACVCVCMCVFVCMCMFVCTCVCTDCLCDT